MLSQSGELLAYVDNRRMEWYIARGLALRIADREFRLTFQHGSGNSSYSVELLPRESKCVVCGAAENLERHHVVPNCFRRSFRDKYKRHNGYDVLAICVACHGEYERKAAVEKAALRNSASEEGEFNRVTSLVKYARTLHKNVASLPPDVITRLWQKLPAELNHDMSALAEFLEAQTKRRDDLCKWADKIVTSYGEERIISFWRKHFLVHAEPRHLPDTWLDQHQMILVKE